MMSKTTVWKNSVRAIAAASFVAVMSLLICEQVFAAEQAQQSRVNRHDRRAGEQLASQQTRQSQDSFNRGLMSLPDYADHLSVALNLKLKLAEIHNDKSAHVEAFSQHAFRLKRAAETLKRFNQPGKKGWATDLVYVSLLSAEADTALAEARGDSVGRDKAASQIERLALRQFEMRLADYKVGLASLPQISRSASHLSFDGPVSQRTPSDNRQRIDLLSDYRQQLGNVVSRTERLSQRGAGLGRTDRLEMARFESARTGGILSSLHGDESGALAQLKQADQHADRVFSSQLEFYQKGTASLFDLSRTWWQRDLVQQRLQQAGYNLPSASGHLGDLDRLTKLANQTTDRRGRNAADVTNVRSLSFLQKLNAASPAELSKAN